jgi:hypothetical protein
MGYGASAIRTDRFTRRFLREACGGLFPCGGMPRVRRDRAGDSAPARADAVDLLARMLIALALHSLVSNRTAVAFVPPGMKSVAPVLLAPDTRRGLALRQMEAALGSEKDVLNCGGWPNRTSSRDCAWRHVARPRQRFRSFCWRSGLFCCAGGRGLRLMRTQRPKRCAYARPHSYCCGAGTSVTSGLSLGLMRTTNSLTGASLRFMPRCTTLGPT